MGDTDPVFGFVVCLWHTPQECSGANPKSIGEYVGYGVLFHRFSHNVGKRGGGIWLPAPNFPGSWIRDPIPREIRRVSSREMRRPGYRNRTQDPGNFPGCWMRGAQLMPVRLGRGPVPAPPRMAPGAPGARIPGAVSIP